MTKRDFLQLTAGITGLSSITSNSIGSVQQNGSEGWPQFQYRANNNANVQQNTGLDSGVQEKWKFEAYGGPGGESIVSSPVVSDGIIYFGGWDGGLFYAIDAAEGTQKWTFDIDSEINSAAAIKDDTVYFGDNFSNFYALNVEDGSLRWNIGLGINGPPTVVGETIYVEDGAKTYAINRNTGEKKWESDTHPSELIDAPAISNQTVYVTSHDGHVHAIDATNGELQWDSSAMFEGKTSPCVVNERVYVGGRNGIYALSATDGKDIWNFETGEVHSTPVVVDGTVYFGSWDGNVYAVDANQGTEQWVFEVDDYDTKQVYSSLTIVDETTYFGAENTVYAVDIDDGTKRWNFEAEGEVWSSPAVVDGSVYFGSKDQHLYALSDQNQSRNTPTEQETTTTATPESTPTNTPEPTPTNTPESTPTNTPEPTPSGTENEDETDLLPIGLGLLGVGGAGAWWLTRRGSDVDDSGSSRGTTIGGSSDQTPPNKSVNDSNSHEPSSNRSTTATTGGTSGSSKSGTASLPNKSHREPRRVPDEIPRAPNISVGYDSLTDREPIGGGGNADVTKATLPTPDGEVTLAIKEPRMTGTLQTDAVERMLEEAETWDKLDDHDHIVGVVDYGSEPLPWIAMEYMDAGHLGDRIGEMEFDQALWTAIATTKAVRHAHRRGIAHLDLKPANILFRSVEDAWDVPKVADWGLSKHLLDHSESVEGMSVEYAAPEQFDDDRGPVDDITDVYQLGAVFYELFTDRPPFQGPPFQVVEQLKTKQPTPPTELADIPPALDEILLTALSKEKDERYESVLLLRNDLQELLEQSDVID